MIDSSFMRYHITEEDLYITKFPYTKVLQLKYTGDSLRERACYDDFTHFVRNYIREYNVSRDISEEEINITIYSYVKTLQEKYPEDFEEAGWYTRCLLGMAFAQGRLILDGKRITNLEYEVYLLQQKEYYSKIAEERRLAEQEESRKRRVFAEEVERLRQESKLSIAVGMLLRSKRVYYNAYQDMYPLRSNEASRQIIAAEHSLIVKEKVGWRVIEVLKEGGTVFPEDILAE